MANLWYISFLVACCHDISTNLSTLKAKPVMNSAASSTHEKLNYMLLGLSGPTSSFWVRAVFFELFLSQCQAQGVLINLVGSLIENVEVIFSQDCFLLEMKSTTNLIIVSCQLLCLCRSGN